MKRNKTQIVEMTPLLDVVFILLFALMLNTSVAKAIDEEEIAEKKIEISVIENRNNMLEEKLEERIVENSENGQSLEEIREELKLSQELSVSQELQIENQKIQIDRFTKSLSELIKEEAIAMEDDLDNKLLEKLKKEGVVLDRWLKYEQIAKRYLFVEIKLSNKEGRVYIDDTYTNISITREDLSNNTSKDEKIKGLSEFLFNWLDHKEGGYSFVFMTLRAEEGVTRGSVEIVFDALNVLQPIFEQDYYLINKYVTYN